MVPRIKLYTRTTPIFDEFNITPELEKALRPKVWLKSGGYIVINQTEALVAIDINTGKYVGKSNRLEDTIVKTNTDAIKEIVRQIRLRDLGGIIVVDFIDMDERKNRQKVMQALEEAMRADRAPYKILQFNDFGLVAITRKRVKQSLERTLCSPCPYCEGAGYVKSVQTGDRRDSAGGAQDRESGGRQGRDAAREPGGREASQVQRKTIPAGDRRDSGAAGAGEKRSAAAPGKIRPGLSGGPMGNYAHPETLVTTDWVAQHASDANVRIAEVDVDTKAYDEGHVPGAIGWAWNSQLCDTVRRDILSQNQFEELMAASGISPDTTVVIYGDNNNWFAAWALWQMKIYGHKDVRLMNGGRKKWLAEGRELSTDRPKAGAAPATKPPRRTSRSGRFCRKCKARKRSPRRRWWTCAARRNSAAKFWRRPDCRRPASAAATSPARAAFPGARPATTTARSSPTTS